MRNVIVLLALWSMTAMAHATSCIAVTVCKSFAESSAVFRGRVTEITPIPLPPAPSSQVSYPDGSEATDYSASPGRMREKVRFEVYEAFKGDLGGSVTVNAPQGMFLKEGEYLVFANSNASSQGIYVDLCSDGRAIRNVQQDDLAWLRAYPHAPETASIFGNFYFPNHPDVKIAGTVTLSGEASKDATIDQDGHYAFRDLSPGTYTVTASLPAGMASLPDELAKYGPQTVTVAAKGCADVDWIVRYDSHIRGTVTNPSGQPVSNIEVALLKAETNRTGFTIIDEAHTDASGRYDLSKADPGEYWVALNPYGPSNNNPHLPVFYPSGSTLSGAVPLPLSASGILENVNLVLLPPLPTAAVHVRVVRKDGTPVNLAAVDAVDPLYPLNGFLAHADANGQAEIHLYAGEEYSLKAVTPGERQPCCSLPITFIAKDGMILDPLVLDQTITYDTPSCDCSTPKKVKSPT